MKKITFKLILFILAASLLTQCGGGRKRAAKPSGYYYPKNTAGDSRKKLSTKSNKSREKTSEIKNLSDDTKKEKSRKTDPGRTERPRVKKEASGLKAGFADDNKQFNYFVRFLNKYGGRVSHYPMNIRERIVFKVTDKKKKSIPNAMVKILAYNRLVTQGKTYADGTFLFFPAESRVQSNEYQIQISYQQKKHRFKINRQGKRKINVVLSTNRSEMKKVPLDMVFVFDTTGSMGDEIERLRTTIEIINLNLASLSSKPKIRFGMVLYRDKEEEYITKVVPLTSDLEAFQKELEKVEADGGGDEPEDLQAGLKDTLQKMKWNKKGIRMAYIITDASSHLDYGQKYTYAKAAKDAKAQAIKIFSIGTGGLPLAGEYVLRQISQYTYAKYIFLTYGERGESEGGRPGSVSHHTGANYQTDKLEAIIIRFAKEELAHLTDQPLKEGEEYFRAVKQDYEKKEETLKKLFERAITQLIDYSSIRIPEKTPTALVPLVPAQKGQKLNAEFFSEQFIFALAPNRTFKMVERKNFQKILGELQLQSSSLFDERKAAKLGKFLGAKMLIVGKLYAQKKQLVLFLKLLRVETGEILSVTKLRLDPALGLGN